MAWGQKGRIGYESTGKWCDRDRAGRLEDGDVNVVVIAVRDCGGR